MAVEHFFQLLGCHPEARTQALNVRSIFTGVDRPANGVEDREQVAEQVDLAIANRVLVFPTGTLAKILKLGLSPEHAILRVAQLLGNCVVERHPPRHRLSTVCSGRRVLGWRIEIILVGWSHDWLSFFFVGFSSRGFSVGLAASFG